jgi:hypothetical protein
MESRILQGREETLVRDNMPHLARVSERITRPPCPRTDGRFLNVRGQRFWVKGVTYGTFRPNAEGEPYPTRQVVRDDFARMREAGVNTVRL